MIVIELQMVFGALGTIPKCLQRAQEELQISHFIERVVYERSWKQRLQYIDPPTLLAITAFLSRSLGLLNRGPGGPASAGTWFSFQLI